MEVQKKNVSKIKATYQQNEHLLEKQAIAPKAITPEDLNISQEEIQKTLHQLQYPQNRVSFKRYSSTLL